MITGIPATYILYGAVNVLSWNNSGTTSSTLGATLILENDNAGAGWMHSGWAPASMGPVNSTPGLPVLGSAFIKANNPSASAGVSGNYGAVFPHSYR